MLGDFADTVAPATTQAAAFNAAVPAGSESASSAAATVATSANNVGVGASSSGAVSTEFSTLLDEPLTGFGYELSATI